MNPTTPYMNRMARSKCSNNDRPRPIIESGIAHPNKHMKQGCMPFSLAIIDPVMMEPSTECISANVNTIVSSTVEAY